MHGYSNGTSVGDTKRLDILQWQVVVQGIRMEGRDMSTSTFSTGSCASNSDATGRQSNGFQFGGNRGGHTGSGNSVSVRHNSQINHLDKHWVSCSTHAP